MNTELKRLLAVERRRVSWIWGGSLAVVIGALLVLGALAGWKYQQIQVAMSQPPPPEPATAVVVVVVGTVQYQSATTAIGTVVAPKWITVSNELPGTVVSVIHSPGSIVEAGSLLFKLDTSVEEAQLAASHARRQIAQSTWRRIQQMAESRAVTELEVEEAASQVQQATAQVAELEALIARKSFHAPFRGRLGISDTHQGQYLPAGTTITTLQSVDDYLLVDFMIPQTISASIGDDQLVTMMHGEQSLTARIIAKDAQADRTTRNVRYRARLDPPPANLLPGDSLQVRVDYGPAVTLAAIPKVALRYSPQGAFVFLAQETETGELRAVQRPVTPAASVGAQIGIAQGIQVGDRVVAEGSFKLQDGALLRDTSGTPNEVELSTARPADRSLVWKGR